jgi:hypothetical protein
MMTNPHTEEPPPPVFNQGFPAPIAASGEFQSAYPFKMPVPPLSELKSGEAPARERVLDWWDD